MKEQKGSFKNKLKKIFTSMCSRPMTEEPQTSIKKSPKMFKKETRQTIIIDDVFVKRSRKNIVEEQFFTNDILNLQMEKHLFLRTKGAAVGLIKGDFSQEVYQGIKFPLFIESKPMNTVPFRQQILSTSTVKFRDNIADVMLVQTSLTMQKMSKKVSKQLIEQEVVQIQLILQSYSKSADNMVVLCSPYLDLENTKPILSKFADSYLFQLENIRKNQELVCNIIYMANNAKFLRLNNKCFIDEILHRIPLSLIEEQKMRKILDNLTEKGFHKEIHQTVKSILREKNLQGTNTCFSQFVRSITEIEQIAVVMSESSALVFKEETFHQTPVLDHPTPNFEKF